MKHMDCVELIAQNMQKKAYTKECKGRISSESLCALQCEPRKNL